jgi:Protein of unknown function (DUF3892)
MTYYITATKKETNCNNVSEIQGYKVNDTKSSGGKYYSKADFFTSHYKDTNTYESYNPETEASAKCKKETSTNRENYLQTVGNSMISDNLLSLPNI